MPLMTIDEIMGRRRPACDKLYNALLDRLEKRSASLSEPNDHTTVINIPPPPQVLSIVSWNVQTFEAGKSLGNPFVNKVINRVLAALDADICILLESRADSFVNMNAIETGLVGSSGWKQAAEEDEEDDEPDQSSTTDGGEPLTYLQNVSEMTGKLWAPPKVIHVYHAGKVAHCSDIKLVVGLARLENKALKKKLTKKEQKTFVKLAATRNKKLQAKSDSLDRAKAASSGEKKFASSYGYQPKLLKSMCVDDFGATQAWLSTLRLKECTPIRDYFDLCFIKDDWTHQTIPWNTDISMRPASDNWRFCLRLKHCTGCNEYLGSGMCGVCEDYGPYTTRLQNLRQAVDAITFFMSTCQESYSILLRPDAKVLSGSNRGLWIKDKLVSAKVNAARLLMRAPDEHDTTHGKVEVTAGHLLGYQDKKIGFYGRCPYLLPIELWLPYEDVSRNLYMVAFHGPFGASTKAGIELRAAAMKEVLNAGVGLGSKLDSEPHVMIVGDFNLDWAPNAPKPSSYQKIAGALYQGFKTRGLHPLIKGGIATSLISIHGQTKWMKVNASSSASYTSSAYDNCFIRGDDVRNHVVTAAVIDVISWIEDNLSDFDLPQSDPLHGKLGLLPKKTQAFYVYRKYVSDHLPIVCDIAVAPMTPRMKALAQQAREERNAKEDRRLRERNGVLARWCNLQQFDVRFEFEAMLDMDTSDALADSYTSKDEKDGSRTGTFVGVIERHQDDHLILKCAPLTGTHRAWLSYRIEGRPRLNAMFLRTHPPGTRMKWVVKNHKPLK